ncbi:MAG: hypothetical protein KDD99_05220, partial [Bacteroidetes bacterium]|nr:hypothetical protein [Bacteroidota bacterium]
LSHLNGKSHVNALLIVTLAHQDKQPQPFQKHNENDTYAHLSELCNQANINLYITHFANAINDSMVLSWRFENGEWKMLELPASEITISYADLPQNFPSANVLRNLLIKNGVIFINHLNMSDSLTDKVLTYQLFPNSIPPTFDTSLPDLSERLLNVSTHPDLRTDKIILKPRYGERGKGIEVIELAEVDSDRVAQMEDYIIQPIMESDSGIPELGIEGRHDLRMLVYNGEIKDCFVRVPQKDNFICNQSHGGRLIYININDIPEKIRGIAGEIDKALSHYSPRYYSIDIGVGRSGKIWVYELNTMPGVVWNADASDKEKYFPMHKTIVNAIESAAVRAGVMS